MNKVTALFIFFVLSLLSVSQAQWKKIFPLDPADFNKITIFDSTRAFISASDGIIWKSSDKGINWVKRRIPTHTDVNDIYFTSADTGYLVETGSMWKTFDGGYSWQQLYTVNNYQFDKILFTKKNIGFAIPPKGSYDKIYRTTDGGVTWIAKVICPDITDITFNTAETGYITTFSGKIYKTTDAGVSWSLLGDNYPALAAVSFSDSITGMIALTSNGILKTINGGNTWTLSADSTITAASDIFSLSPKLAYISGNEGIIYRTTDAGVSWFAFYTGLWTDFKSVGFFSSTEGLVVGSNSKLMQTSNGGIQWIAPLSRTYRLKKIISGGENHLFAISEGFLFKSTDAGDNWSLKEFSYQLLDIYCTDSLNVLMLVTSSYGYGKLLGSSDGGENWSLKIDSISYPEHLDFVNKNIGFLTSQNYILQTTNGGINWSKLQPEASFSGYVNIASFDSNNVILAKRFSQFIKTTNGGNDWINYSLPFYNSAYFYKIIITSPQIIFASIRVDHYYNFYTGIVKSTDGGLTWAKIYNYMYNGNAYGQILDLDFKDENNVTAVGHGGHICSTTNGGANWTVQTSGTTKHLEKVLFTSEKTAYITGDNIILKTTNYGVTFVQSESKNTPDNFTLLQNYPNPFNPSTTIRYQVPESGLITLKVYDILGKEVSLLVNEIKQPGTYEVPFNGSTLSSGVYFYKFSASGISSVKKMFLVK